MVKTIKSVLSNEGFTENIVLVRDQHDVDTISKEIVDADVVYPDKAMITREMIMSAEKVRLFQYGTGYDTIDLESAGEKNVPVCNMPGITAQSVAEHAMYLILALAKNDREYCLEMREGRWNRGVGTELAGKTLGLIGFGNIGRIHARTAWGFGMNIIACRNNKKQGNEGVDFVDVVDFNYLLEKSDIVSILLPLIKHGSCKTEGMIGENELAKIGDTGLGWLINTSRGAIIKEDELIASLESGIVKKAALDVYETEPLPEHSKLRKLSNVFLTPHIAGDTKEALIRRYTLIAENTIKVMNNERPQYIVKELKSFFI
ncbi:D-isomer specific 2-hydroxyacid dehydrogenase NAD-binding protein [Candidatus Scalindua japonica]|uniref:D-isomer specific 2-hydroxyacid dehydrogenase NAD-binding protein n=1 Tax=Candidatus Scalindua japonica TaxID=1284222 RepID=A0A286TXF8_9BACT|nr:NAD(P)-dependent oxidoreductase [Candidatus Scalindua japonica]GAX60585.1 D-isomer specific 2-hydroxyacid dehydrogenase NAD-binding protein [Candidatus Scalindua japonica]